MTTTTDGTVWYIVYRRSQTGEPSPALVPGTDKACGFLSEYDRANLLGTPQKICKPHINHTLSAIAGFYPCEVYNDGSPKSPSS